MSVLDLWLPILLSGVAIFFVSFLSWMVLQFHKRDWNKTPDEDAVLASVRSWGLPPDNYMFPQACSMEEMKQPEFAAKLQQGPRGIVTVFRGPPTMGPQLAKTFLLFLAVSFSLAYLATIGLKPGAAFIDVFRFFAAAGFVAFSAGPISNRIWFQQRLTGHLIDALLFGLVLGAIFGGMWPAA